MVERCRGLRHWLTKKFLLGVEPGAFLAAQGLRGP
jgi:hypothetical protein